MGSFTYLSVAALFCYSFLFFTLLAARKNPIVNACLLLLGSMLLWTGGSLLMRMQAFPSVKLWYDLSLLGLIALAFSYLLVRFALTGGGRRTLIVWGAVFLTAWTLNTACDCLLAAPVPVGQGGSAVFTYELGVGALLLTTLLVGALVHMAAGLLGPLRRDASLRRAFRPFAAGLLFIVLGHLLLFLPVRGIPFDLMGGVLNAVCVFYGLYRHNLFRLTLLASRGSCSVLTGMMSIVLFSQIIRPMYHFAAETLGLSGDDSLLAISLLVTLATFGLYRLLTLFIDRVFSRDETTQAEQLKEFSEKISRSLKLREILDCMTEIVMDTVCPSRLTILIRDAQSGDFLPVSGDPPEGEGTRLPQEHPVVLWLAERQDCLLMPELCRSPRYQNLRPEEREPFEALEVECAAPLKDGEDLVGILLLAKKKGRGGHYHFNDISLLNSINSIGSIAVTNARLYAKAYLESRTDELTGLYNRKHFYELFEEEMEKVPAQSLALCLFSVDELKLYNQLYGYKEGDQAITGVGAVIAKAVGADGIVARHSGKVFAVLLPCYDLQRATRLAETIRQQVSRMHRARKDGALRTLTVSCGVAAIPCSATNAKDLFEHADLALFHVKHNGKNAVLAYTKGNHSLEKARVSVAEQRTVYGAYENTVFALMAAIDAKDHYTFKHSMNVLHYATRLAEHLNMSAEYIEIIREAALLHDIGKIGIPEHILNKIGALSAEEYESMKGHVEQSITMIKFLPSLDYVIPTVIGHHERYDGRGYPRGLKGEEIPLGARILCIADSFDAMMSKRSYKEAYPLEHTLAILEEEAGRQFDPQLVVLFIRLLREGLIELKGVPVAEDVHVVL